MVTSLKTHQISRVAPMWSNLATHRPITPSQPAVNPQLPSNPVKASQTPFSLLPLAFSLSTMFHLIPLPAPTSLRERMLPIRLYAGYWCVQNH